MSWIMNTSDVGSGFEMDGLNYGTNQNMIDLEMDTTSGNRLHHQPMKVSSIHQRRQRLEQQVENNQEQFTQRESRLNSAKENLRKIHKQNDHDDDHDNDSMDEMSVSDTEVEKYNIPKQKKEKSSGVSGGSGRSGRSGVSNGKVGSRNKHVPPTPPTRTIPTPKPDKEGFAVINSPTGTAGTGEQTIHTIPSWEDNNYNSAVSLAEDTTTTTNAYKKINYIVHLLEERKDQRTGMANEEIILYGLLGVFTIFLVDNFVRVGRYVR